MLRHRSRVLAIFSCAAVFMAGGAYAQSATAPGAGPAPVQGFSVPALVMELSLFLPPRSMGPGAAGGPRGPGAAEGRTDGAAPGAPGASGVAAPGAPQGAGPGAPQGAARDPALYLTAAQVDSLLPLLQGLWKNPFPTPSAARSLTAAVDAILTPAQKEARDAARVERAKRLAERGAGGAPGEGGQGFFSRLQSMSAKEREAFLQNLPPEARQRLEQRLKQGAAGSGAGQPALSPLEQRQRLIAAAIEALQVRRKALGGKKQAMGRLAAGGSA